MPDPAKWIELVEVYLKGEVGPSWDWTILPVDGKDVLVLTVDPPQAGDPPWPLRKEFGSHRSGTLFVRKPGKTEPALAEDIDALGRRTLAGRSQLPQLLVNVHGDIPIPWLTGDVDAWVEHERERLMAAAKAVEYERNRPASSLGAPERLNIADLGRASFLAEQATWHNTVAGMQALHTRGFAGLQDEPDERTFEEYAAEVDSWADGLAEPALRSLLHRYCKAGYGLVRIRVTNDSTQYLPGVEVRLHISFEHAQGFESVPDGGHIPKAPWPFGKAKPNPLRYDRLLPMPSASIMPSFRVHDQGLLRDTSIEDGSIKVTLNAGDLRPTASHDGDDFYICLPARPAGGSLHATWTATVQYRDGLIKGDLSVPVQKDSTDISDILGD